MAWVAIADNLNWEYSTIPEIDDPYNAHNYVDRHTDGIRTNVSDLTEIYVYCRKINEPIGYGEIRR